MLPDERDLFGEYASEPQTVGMQTTVEAALVEEIETDKYGRGKPRRIIVRGIVAADAGIKDRRE